MNRKRKSNRGLPARVYVKNGAYKFYAVEKMRDPADGQEKHWIKLASVAEGEAAMLTALGKLLGERQTDKAGMVHLCQEFRARKLAKYSEEVRKQYAAYLALIADDFEDFQVRDVMTKHWSEFLRNNYAGKPNTARKITAVARKLFRFAISEFGLREDNPLDQIDLDDYETKRREVIPTHDQVAAIRAAAFIGKDGRKTLSGPTLACIIDISYLCWQRGKDFRLLKESQIEAGRIRFKPTKTERSSGLAVDIVITPAIQEVIDRARAIKREHGMVCGYLFPKLAGKHKGEAYSKTGLFSMWDRARERAGITDDVQFKDLRALGATDAAKAGQSKQAIQNRLVHTEGSTTEIYIKEAVPVVSEIDVKLPWSTR
jgi:site-specific recombinase XerD